MDDLRREKDRTGHCGTMSLPMLFGEERGHAFVKDRSVFHHSTSRGKHKWGNRVVLLFLLSYHSTVISGDHEHSSSDEAIRS